MTIQAIHDLLEYLAREQVRRAVYCAPLTQGQALTHYRMFEAMRRESAEDSILHDHPDDPTYGWGDLSFHRGAAAPTDEPNIFHFAISICPERILTPDLVILHASVTEEPTPFWNDLRQPWTTAVFASRKSRFMTRKRTSTGPAKSLRPSLVNLLCVLNEQGIPYIHHAPPELFRGDP